MINLWPYTRNLSLVFFTFYSLSNMVQASSSQDKKVLKALTKTLHDNVTKFENKIQASKFRFRITEVEELMASTDQLKKIIKKYKSSLSLFSSFFSTEYKRTRKLEQIALKIKELKNLQEELDCRDDIDQDIERIKRCYTGIRKFHYSKILNRDIHQEENGTLTLFGHDY